MLSMAYNSEINTPDTDNNVYYGVDAVCQNLAKLLKTNITWLEKSFGRTRMTVKGSNSEPQIYLSEKEYYSVVPNDSYKAYSFFYVYGPHKTMDETNVYKKETLLNANAALIVWVNLQAINPDNDSLYTSSLIKDILAQLRKSSNVTVQGITDDNATDIFMNLKGYFMRPGQRDLLMYPYQAFRIDLLLNYDINYCVQ